MLKRTSLTVNIITFSRGMLLAFFPAFAAWNELTPNSVIFAICLTLLAISSLTDFIDGWLARLWNVTTPFGALADPLMDKIFYICTMPTVLMMAAARGERIHSIFLLMLAVTFLIRDQWVSFLRSIGAHQGASMSANWSGKVRTLLAFPIIILVFLCEAAGWRSLLPAIMCGEILCFAINLLSIWVYSRAYWPYLLRAFQSGR